MKNSNINFRKSSTLFVDSTFRYVAEWNMQPAVCRVRGYFIEDFRSCTCLKSNQNCDALIKGLLHYRPQTKLREGNVFTPVCQSLCSQGVCVVGDMHGRGVYVALGYVWWGGICGGGICGRGHAWQGSVHGRGCVLGGCACRRQERRPLKRTVRILLECIFVLLKF